MFERTSVIVFFCLIFSIPAQAKSIKCVDSKGVTHYGDTIPSECADRPVVELDDNGMPMKESAANMTSDERREMEVEVQKAATQAQKVRDEKRRDSTLLSTYASEAEIDLARDRNMKQLSLALDGVEAKLKIANDRLSQYNAQMVELSSKGQSTPPDLQKSAAAAKTEISDLEVERAQKKQDLDAMKAKYDADKKRYEELTQKQPPK